MYSLLLINKLYIIWATKIVINLNNSIILAIKHTFDFPSQELQWTILLSFIVMRNDEHLLLPVSGSVKTRRDGKNVAQNF